MKLKVLGSSSSGNCYLIESKTEILIIEAGISFKKIQEGLNFNIDKVAGCLVSHEHKDHSKAIEQLKTSGIDIYTSKGTIKATDAEISHRIKVIKSKERFKVGEFTVLPFDAQHDAKEPLGFLIQHKDMGKLLFITDSYYCKYKFKGLDHILIECNYKKDILYKNIESGKVKEFLSNRIIRSHFEIENVKGFLRESDLSKTKNIVLIHLSSQNSDGNLFKSEIERVTGIPTYAAKKGLELNISKQLF